MQPTASVYCSTTDFTWQTYRNVRFNELSADPVSLGPLDYNGTHLLSIDLNTFNMMVIDLNLTTILENVTIIHYENGSYYRPFFFGFVNAKNTIFAADFNNQSIHLLDKNNFSVVDSYYHDELIADLAYDEITDTFIVPFFSRQIITVYNGSYWNGSLNSLEIGSLDSPALIGAYFFPSNTPPTNIASYGGECLIFELRSGLYSQFTVDLELGDLFFNTDEWTRASFESYAFFLQDAAIVNKTCIYFASPGANKISMFIGEEVITTTTTTFSHDTSTTTTTSTNPLYSSGIQTDPAFWGAIILIGGLLQFKKKRK